MRRHDERGAALVLVIILVTVIGLGLVALLSLADTNVKATVGLRDQASESYAADAAAKIAVDGLRAGTYAGGNCDTDTTMSLNDFYPATNTAARASAAVLCTADPANTEGGGGSNSSPGSAILTLGTGQDGERGLVVDDSNNETVKVNGGIFSNSTIFLSGNKSDLENTATNSYVYAMGSCTSSGTSQIISNPAAVCNYSGQPQSTYDRRGKDPATVPAHGTSFDTPPAPTTAQTPPACTGKNVYELQPGLYTDATLLNNLTNGASCSKAVFHFNPGRYYFNFTDAGTHRWTISGGYLVGGIATATLKTNPAPSMPGSCVIPGSAAATTSSGVQFVFGGDSRMEYTKNGTDYANIELCASNADSGPPIAIYGLKSSIGSGALSVPAQSGCVTETPYTTLNGGDSSHCAVIQSYQDPNPRFTVWGTTYTPRSMIDLYLNNNTVQVFRWGLISRGIRIGSTGSAGSLTNPVIDVPDDAPAPFPTPNLIYLNVYVCPAASTCGTSGSVRLRVKVLVSSDPPRTISVIGWNNQR